MTRYLFSMFIVFSSLIAQEKSDGVMIPVKVTSDPLRSVVYMDGIEKGITPITLQVTIGEHKIRVTKDNFGEYNQTLSVHATDKSLTVNAFLPNLTTLNLLMMAPSSISTGEVEVYLDGQLLGFPPIEKLVVEGNHELRIVAASDCLKEYNKTVSVKGDINLVTQVEAFLEFSDAYVSLKPEVKKEMKRGEINFTVVTSERQAQKASTAAVEAKKTSKAKVEHLNSSTNTISVIILVLSVVAVIVGLSIANAS